MSNVFRMVYLRLRNYAFKRHTAQPPAAPESPNSPFHSRHRIKILVNDLCLNEVEKLINMNSSHNEIIRKSFRSV